jgi:DNA modification methylase
MTAHYEDGPVQVEAGVSSPDFHHRPRGDCTNCLHPRDDHHESPPTVGSACIGTPHCPCTGFKEPTAAHYEDGPVQVFHGDCIDVMATLPPGSVDAVVCDPPYGLEFMGKDWDSFKRIPSGGAGINGTGYTDGGNRLNRPSFTGSPNPGCRNCGGFQRGTEGSTVRPCRCDAPDFPNVRRAQMHAFQAWCEDWAREAYRLLKPGGHLLAFGGTRTFHRLTAGIEDAGFEIRDSIAWLYGSGFPKSLDVSKAIDKRGGTVADFGQFRDACRTAMQRHAIRVKDINAALGNVMSSRYLTAGAQPAVPNLRDYRILRDLLHLGDQFDELFQAEADREETGRIVSVTGRRIAPSSFGEAGEAMRENRETAPATADAARWNGWGTALKPAFEPIVVARKPLEGTVAANVLAYGTGALNIDGSRIGTEERTYGPSAAPGGNAVRLAGGDGRDAENARAYAQASKLRDPVTVSGRWPANVVLDASQAAALDAQSGVLTSGANPTRRSSDKFRDTYGEFKGQTEIEPARGADSGGASRFFYTAKASTDERPSVDGIAHPTVKPVDLMRWLVKLVTPPGGIVLEPFAGSGTTVEACVLEGFRCIAIEREGDYLPLILKRIRKPHAVGLDFGEWEA